MKRLITLCSITLALSAFAGVTARYTFDDDGNGGLNLLKAAVGEDAIVRGGKPAADVSGIGELHATNDMKQSMRSIYDMTVLFIICF